MADRRRVRLVLVLDCLLACLVAAAVAIELTGGIFTSFGGIRVSARSVDRAAFLALALAAVRWTIGARQPPFGMDPARYAALRRRLTDPGADAPGRLALLPAVRAVLGLGVAGLVLLWPQLRRMDSVPDLGDPLFSIWRIGWVFHQIQGDPRPLFDGNIFHPDPLTLTYSDAMLLTSAMAAPLLALGVHPVTVYNVLFVSGFLLSGAAAYLLVARLTGSARAGFVGALVFGFYPYRFEHYSHLELQMTVWMPLGLLAVHRFVETARWPYALLAALAVVAQLYSSMYYGVFFPIVLAALAFVLARQSGRSIPRLLGPSAVAAAIALLLALPLARPYLAARTVKGDRGHDAVRVFSATASDYLRAHERSALYGSRLLPGARSERALFPGVVPIVLTAAALVPPLGPIRLAYLAGLLVAFDGSLGFNGLLYPYLYEWVPGVSSMRVPARFSIIVGLTLAVLAGFGVRLLLRGRRGWTQDAAFALIITAAMADVWPRLVLQPVWREPPAIYGRLAEIQGAVLAEFPLNTDPAGFAENTPFMYFSLSHWKPLVNGYSGFLPPGYEAFVQRMDGFPDEPSISLLKERGVTHVSINCALYRRPCADVLRTLDGLASVRPVAEALWEGAPVRLYELR
ncbi:MAG TPA: hypothetical protein VD833_10800 [Vicinamibacterales bacterium]|nr:hypothetical protein [Vicinamibacterales bacterium]